MTGEPLKYLCAVLNNPLITWFMKSTALTDVAGKPEWLKPHVEKIPVPQIPAEQQQDFIQRVDLILNAKDADPEADTSELEAEINQLVYELYDLTAEEIKIIEEKARHSNFTTDIHRPQRSGSLINKNFCALCPQPIWCVGMGGNKDRI